MATRKKKETEDQPLERLLELIDQAVEARGTHVKADVQLTERIAELTSEARRKGASMPQLTKHVRRMDRRDLELKPVTRQALDNMLAVHEGRREPRTTRASRRRRRRDANPGGGVNLDALR